MREFSTIKERILQFLELKGITKYAFYKTTGIANGVLSQANGISEENLLKFLDCYPEVNPGWLVRGEGPVELRSAPAWNYGRHNTAETACMNDVQAPYGTTAASVHGTTPPVPVRALSEAQSAEAATPDAEEHIALPRSLLGPGHRCCFRLDEPGRSVPEAGRRYAVCRLTECGERADGHNALFVAALTDGRTLLCRRSGEENTFSVLPEHTGTLGSPAERFASGAVHLLWRVEWLLTDTESLQTDATGASRLTRMEEEITDLRRRFDRIAGPHGD